jgi:hypothetical protein
MYDSFCVLLKARTIPLALGASDFIDNRKERCQLDIYPKLLEKILG